jgi:hypothetical protein
MTYPGGNKGFCDLFEFQPIKYIYPFIINAAKIGKNI